MTENRTPTYDTAEAESLLALARGRIQGTYEVEKGEAGTTLVESLQAVLQGLGLKPSVDQEGTLYIRDRGRTVMVGEVGGEILLAGMNNVTNQRGDRVPAPLDFDPRTKLFVGREFDEFYVPEPGKPRRKRSALAVVTEMVVGMLYGDRAEKKEGE